MNFRIYLKESENPFNIRETEEYIPRTKGEKRMKKKNRVPKMKRS
jgi:hypothetical protein